MFEVTARLKVRDGELEGFKRQAIELMRETRAKDTKTLRYDWFLGDDGISCEVREGYVDADGLLDHHHHIEEPKAVLFHEFAEGHDMTLYDEPSPALAEALKGMAHRVAFHRYSFLQGLDGGVEIPPKGAFEATAQLVIRPGQLDAFRHQVSAIIGQVQEQDVKPLRYDWFLGEDGSRCEVREVYPDADALLAQQRRVAEAKMKLIRECIAGHRMTFYGELSPALAGALESMGAAFDQFSFFQGLHVEARDTVPA